MLRLALSRSTPCFGIITTLALGLCRAAAVDVLTYHNDFARTGQNTNETVLSPSNLGTNTFGKLFAYPVDGHKKGTYLLTYFKTDGSTLKDIVADCHLSEYILRELILKVHPKLVDHLVTQAMTSTPTSEEEGAREEEHDDRPRRRRRED